MAPGVGTHQRFKNLRKREAEDTTAIEATPQKSDTIPSSSAKKQRLSEGVANSPSAGSTPKPDSEQISSREGKRPKKEKKQSHKHKSSKPPKDRNTVFQELLKKPSTNRATWSYFRKSYKSRNKSNIIKMDARWQKGLLFQANTTYSASLLNRTRPSESGGTIKTS